MAVTSLTVERRVDPIGIDAARPRFSWQPGVDQVAYRVQVALSPEWSSPLWDSGRRSASDSTYVPYAGAPLVSRQRYAWRVAVWSSGNAEPEWSEPSAFEMGLLDRTD